MNREIQSIYDTVFKDYPDVLGVEQVSSILNVSTKTVYKIIKAGTLSCLRIGRQIRIPKYFLIQYLNIEHKEDL